MIIFKEIFESSLQKQRILRILPFYARKFKYFYSLTNQAFLFLRFLLIFAEVEAVEAVFLIVATMKIHVIIP